MPAIKLEQFGGMLPAWDPHLLPSGQAALSKNGYLFSGSLVGWRRPKLLRPLVNPSARTVYRVPTVRETQAIAYLVFPHQPIDGDTVTVGELTYTWRTALNEHTDGGDPQDVQIGTDITQSARNFVAALTADLNLNTNAGVWYGNNTVSNGQVKFYVAGTTPQTGLQGAQQGTAVIASVGVDYVFVGSTDFGAAFNLVNVSESSATARMLWLTDLLSLSHTTTTYTGGSNPNFDNDIAGAATWMEFADPDTNVIKSPVVDDQFNRYYFASPSQPPKYNTYDRIVAGQPAWLLGVPAPGCAPILNVVGGGNNLTLGNYTVGGGDLTGLGNQIYLTQVITPGATQIADVQFRLSPGGSLDDATCHFAALIFDDNGGTPGELLDTGQIVTGVRNEEPNISSFLNPPSLLANTAYWIGFMIDNAAVLESGPAGGASNTYQFNNTFSNGPPATAPTVGGGLKINQPGLNMWGDFVTSDVIEARSYVYTWVSAYGEEGPPSPAAIQNGWSNGTWTVDLWQPPPDDLGVNRNLKKINLYRTVVGQGGSTVFFFVASVDIGTGVYVDSIPDNTVALNIQLPSTTWFPPPENLQGLVVLPNGIIAGWVNNEVWFSQPFQTHAWPPGYVLTTDFPVVGLGVTNGALVVCTAAMPYVVSGTQPGTMTMTKCTQADPCISRASILGGDAAVSFMSPNGLIQVTPQGVASNTTDLWFTRENWKQLTPQKYPRAIYLASCYYCLGSVSPPSVSPADATDAQRGFSIELSQDNTSFTIWPQPGGHRLGFEILDTPVSQQNVLNVLTDPWTGIGLVVANGGVYYFDFADPAPAMIPYTWRSKIYQQNNKRNYEAMKVFLTVPTNTPAQRADVLETDLTDPTWTGPLPSDMYGILRTYADVDGTGNMSLVSAREIRKSGGLMRLPDGFKAEQWQWEVSAQVVISNIQIATTAKELAGV